MCGHVLRGEKGNFLRETLNFEVHGGGERDRSKSTWKRKAEEEMKKIGLTNKDATNRVRWRKGLHVMIGINEANPATFVDGDNTGFKKLD